MKASDYSWIEEPAHWGRYDLKIQVSDEHVNVDSLMNIFCRLFRQFHVVWFSPKSRAFTSKLRRKIKVPPGYFIRKEGKGTLSYALVNEKFALGLDTSLRWAAEAIGPMEEYLAPESWQLVEKMKGWSLAALVYEDPVDREVSIELYYITEGGKQLANYLIVGAGLLFERRSGHSVFSYHYPPASFATGSVFVEPYDPTKAKKLFVTLLDLIRGANFLWHFDSYGVELLSRRHVDLSTRVVYDLLVDTLPSPIEAHNPPALLCNDSSNPIDPDDLWAAIEENYVGIYLLYEDEARTIEALQVAARALNDTGQVDDAFGEQWRSLITEYFGAFLSPCREGHTWSIDFKESGKNADPNLIGRLLELLDESRLKGGPGH